MRSVKLGLNCSILASEWVQLRIVGDEVVAGYDEHGDPGGNCVAYDDLIRSELTKKSTMTPTPMPEISEYSGIAAGVRFSEQS
jgi:hypothetical protein